jgi:serine/threonine-protein kinase
MGIVYKAYQISAERDVALKVLFPHLIKNTRLLERFYREARVMGRLDHPNIVRGYAVGEEQGWHYFAMEFVDGRSLQKWLTLLGRLSVGDALHITLACADALGYAHGQDLVHRDVKPDNILITRRGQIKVTDLGAVKLLDEDLSLTQTGNGIGTPCYMPLEQARNAKESDGRSDIYALGCMLYCMLTGSPPFNGATLVELIQAKDAGWFPPARRLNSEVPERLDLIIDKMVAKAVRYRYQSCAEVIRDLRGLGLANTTLSFIPTDTSAEPATPISRPPAKAPAPAAPAPARPAPPAPAEEGDWWYVCYRTEKGPVTRKLTTAQVRELIATRGFDPTAVASRTLKDGYRSLACYREFGQSMFGRATKGAADLRTARFRNLYKQIVDEEVQVEERVHDEYRGPEEAPSGWLPLLYRVAVIAVVATLVYFGLKALIHWLLSMPNPP